MDVKDFYYELPEELIAQDPLKDRSASRLMVLDRNTGAVEHRYFRDILDYLRPGDCLVLNNTRVIPARLYGVRILEDGTRTGVAKGKPGNADFGGQASCQRDSHEEMDNGELAAAQQDEPAKNRRSEMAASQQAELAASQIGQRKTGERNEHRKEQTGESESMRGTPQEGIMGGKVELLLLKRREKDVWETLVRPGKKCRPGAKLCFGDGILKGEILEVVDDGNRLVRFSYEGIFEEILDQLGQMPLPPYITHELADKNRYQTVYARYDGSAAAPTAGLHFTKELLEEVREKGIKIAEVTLHVGLGTFRPVKVQNILDHHMHEEYYQITTEAAETINRVKASGGRIISVGTTSTRTLETVADEEGRIHPGSGQTDIFIYPGYQFKVIDGLITNFHLPESTLLMLVSALAGREHVLAAYREAVREKYRFFSFGDASLIL